VAFSLLYVGLPRLPGLLVLSWRSEAEQDVEIMVSRAQGRSVKVRSTDVSWYLAPTEVSSPGWAACFLKHFGGVFTALPTLDFVATGSWP
jgi:hypothetical protein